MRRGNLPPTPDVTPPDCRVAALLAMTDLIMCSVLALSGQCSTIQANRSENYFTPSSSSKRLAEFDRVRSRCSTTPR